MLTTRQASHGACRAVATVLRCFTTEPLQHPRGCWLVSSHGRICNTRGVISLGSLHPSGYHTARIRGQMWKVHRVVKITFHGLPKTERAWQVNHLDGDQANNHLDNLEYVTPSENVRHSYSNPSRRRNGPAQSKPVLWRLLGSTSWTTSPSVTAAAQELNISKQTVSRCSRSQSGAKGYEFKCQEDVFQHAWPGEEWRPMLHPLSGAQVSGRMVSSLGRITSRTGLTSWGHLTRQGYYTTGIRINALDCNTFVHRLVAVAFIGPPPSDQRTYVNHKDLNKGNNAADNLEWVSQAENLAHFFAESTLGRGTTAKPVWSRLRGTDDEWRWYHSLTSAAHELRVDRRAISKCTGGLQRQTGGYEFQLADAPETDPWLPGEEWRTVNELLLQRDREIRGLHCLEKSGLEP